VSDLELKAQNASSIIPPAELHGLVCGLAATGHEQFPFPDFVELAGADVLTDEATVSEFVNDSLEILLSPDFSFQPLLPDDDEELAVRLTALSEWCAGFLSGFAAGIPAEARPSALPPDVQEILHDFVSISGLDTDAEGGEQDETSYMELFEYVKVGAVLVLNLMADGGQESGGDGARR
jgi:uncharacterized protein YgfB (UPF0149 family)